MVYRTTSSPVFSLRREIDRLFDDTFGGEQTARRGWIPAVDVRESTGDFTFELELPGIAPEQVELTADNGVLTVRGEKTQRTEKEGDDRRYHVVERGYGSFVRAFQLPKGIDEERIAAEFAHGVLTVRVPKAERPQPRRIQIAETDGDRQLERGDSAQGARSEGREGEGNSGRASARVEGAGPRRSERRDSAGATA